MRRFKIKQKYDPLHKHLRFFIYEKEGLFYKKSTGIFGVSYGSFSFVVSDIKEFVSGNIKIKAKYFMEKVYNDKKTDPS